MRTVARDDVIDKTKGILIFFVVFGHFLEQYAGWDDEASGFFLRSIYLFHMPAFIFISGMFFKAENWKNSFSRYFAIFIVFQILYIIFDLLISGGGSFEKWVNRPYWIMWFMFTLSIYCLITPILMQYKQAMIASIILSVYIGLVSTDNYPYSIGRTLSFLPFFIAGALYGKELCNVVRAKKTTLFLSLFILTVICFASYFVEINPKWLFGVSNINDFGHNYIYAIFIKLCLLVISFLAVISLIRVSVFLPDFLKILGNNSLSIYLFHGFIILLVAQFIEFTQSAYVLVLVCFAASIATCMIFKEHVFSSIIASLTKPISKVFK
ncbi:acyltransferase family protein [Acinetobacter sp. YH01006]|uniref:acyltransferase family protein n=1 Tax=Acinetobacter sp. YH01006 TaxID=2601022 RepID=UPI0015D3F3BC|nr:acyltransferase family protein [Acinetobacter sp. YH01006]